MKLQKTQSRLLSLDLPDFEEVKTIGHGSFGIVKLVKNK